MGTITLHLRRSILAAAVLLAVAPAARAADTDYWFAWPEGTSTGTGCQVVISAPDGGSGTVIWNTSASSPFSLLPGETATVAIPPDAMVVGSGMDPDGAIRVETNDDVTVTVFFSETYSGDAVRPLRVAELGTEYLVASSPADDVDYPSQFLVVALEDGTDLVITASDGNTAGLPPDVPTGVSLFRGQVYQVQSALVGGDLTGSIITSNVPVAVISGHTAGFIPAGESCCASFMAACLPPVSAWGTEFVVGPTMTRAADRFRVISAATGTVIHAPGYPGVSVERGDFIEFSASQGATVSASDPVLLAQYFTSSSADGVTNADPALLIPPPRSAWQTRYVLPTSDETPVSHYLNLITTTADTAAVTVDGSPVPSAAWVVGAELSMAFMGLAPGTHVVAGAQPLSARVYGFRSAWSYGYYGGGDYAGDPPPEPRENPVITGLVDVPNDQGRQLRLTFAGSSLDTVGSGQPVVQYALYRRHDPDLKALPHKDAGWDFVGAVPAFGEDSYATIVPTLADSTLADGPYWSIFMVRAATSVPTIFYDSPPDSGYSLDNLAPSVPSQAALTDDVLAWDDPVDADFRHFTVYGSAVDVLDGSAALLGHTVAPVFDVAGLDHDYYHVTATDFAGNESAAAAIDAVSGVLPGAVRDLVLRQNRPNPFNPRTRIVFELAAESVVSVRVYDVSGRLVREVVDAAFGVGRHEVVWDGRDDAGRRLASGTYFCRVAADDRIETGRMMLVK